MGVSSTVNRMVYSGDGVTLGFSFPYYFFNASDLNVYIYDTVAGGVTPQVINVNYVVSGTQNAQGLYPNGANIVFGAAPASTAKITVVRNPSPVQNYALLQNGNINSLALVQAFDYQCLLIQRMNDLVNRAFAVPDGVAATFSGQLPTNIALNPSAYPQINPSGNGLVLSATTPTTAPIVIPYTSLQTAGTTITVPVLTLPALQIVTGVIIKHTVAFTGTSISALTVGVGTVGDPNFFINGFNVMQTVADQAFDNIAPNFIGSFASTTQINLTATATGANLSALTAGSVSIYFTTTTV